MAEVGIPSIEIIFAVFLFTPGFVALKSAKHFGKITKKYDRFDKTFYTLIISGTSTFLIILFYSYAENIPLRTIVSNPFTIGEIVLGYFAIFGLAVFGGVSFGLYLDKWKYRGEENRKDDTWRLVFDGKEDPAEVRVVTNEGSELYGYVYINDTEPHGQDILLRWPQTIIRNEDGTISDKVSIGDYVFVSEAEISHIFFETEINI